MMVPISRNHLVKSTQTSVGRPRASNLSQKIVKIQTFRFRLIDKGWKGYLWRSWSIPQWILVKDYIATANRSIITHFGEVWIIQFVKYHSINLTKPNISSLIKKGGNCNVTKGQIQFSLSITWLHIYNYLNIYTV